MQSISKKRNLKFKKSNSLKCNKRAAVKNSLNFFGTFSKNRKGFGDAASTLIMFIAVISVTTGLVIAFTNYVKSTEDSFNYQNKLTNNKLRTSVSITNVYYNASSTTLYVYVKNIGETKLYPSRFDVFIDSAFTNSFNISYADNLSKEMEILDLQETSAVIKDINLGTGSHTVRINTEYGVGDDEYFNI